MKFENKMEKYFPRYYLYINSNEKFLMGAKKIFAGTSTVYYISREIDDFNIDSKAYLGKISSNFVGNEFNIYDRGKSGKEAKLEGDLRAQLGFVSYVKINFVKIRK